MGRFTLVAFTAVLFSLFMETEANPFVYNYERLKIGGLVFACLLVAGGVGLLFYNQCIRSCRRSSIDNNDI
ncbi:FXYD domain-containing ion transport regulator 11 [Odontesthes bonariensis]|uniref:FXYD domain-containing ion transport regulator 11 n=1 Tax=Odontesthes bonariensis TaxID=219752 RepID=UPI003F58B42D